MLSVPYALYAGNVQNNKDDDADPQNEMISDIYLSGTFLYIVEGGLTTVVDLTDLRDGMEDADADPENELQDLSLNGNELSLTQDASSVDLNKFLDNTDNQQLTLEGQNLTIQNGNTVVLTDNVNDADADPVNEIQRLALTGHELTIEGGNTVILPDNVDDADHDPTNEIQVLSLEGGLLTLTTNGTPIQIDLAPYLDRQTTRPCC